VPKFTALTHYGAEHCSRGHQSWSLSIDCQRFMEPEGSLPHSQELSTCPYHEPDQSSPNHPISPRSFLILSTHLVLVFLAASFPPLTYTRSSSSLCMLHPPPISSSSTWSIITAQFKNFILFFFSFIFCLGNEMHVSIYIVLNWNWNMAWSRGIYDSCMPHVPSPSCRVLLMTDWTNSKGWVLVKSRHSLC
jgi:hypothetical protein